MSPIDELAQSTPFPRWQILDAYEKLGGDLAYTARACILAQATPGTTPYGVALTLKGALSARTRPHGYALTVRTHDGPAAEQLVKALTTKGLPFEGWPHVPQIVITRGEVDRLATRYAVTAEQLGLMFTVI